MYPNPARSADCRFTRDRARFVDTLDVVKFVCKDLWTIMFKKQIDNLKTNHRVFLPSFSSLLSAFFFLSESDQCPLLQRWTFLQGVYVLQDNNFRWFLRMSTETG